MSDSGLSWVRSVSASLGPTQSCQQSWPHCRESPGHLGLPSQSWMRDANRPSRTVLLRRAQCTCQLCCAAEKKYAFGNREPINVRASQGQPSLAWQNENICPGLWGLQPTLPVRGSWAPRASAGTGFIIQYGAPTKPHWRELAPLLGEGHALLPLARKPQSGPAVVAGRQPRFSSARPAQSPFPGTVYQASWTGWPYWQSQKDEEA